MTDADDPNPYARPSAWPQMPRQPIRITETGVKPAEPARPPLRQAQSTAAILSGSAMPMGRRAAPAVEPPVDREPPRAEPIPPFTVATLEIAAPRPRTLDDEDDDWMRPPPRRARGKGIPAWIPTAGALSVAAIGVAVLLAVSNRSPPPAPAPDLIATAPSPAPAPPPGEVQPASAPPAPAPPTIAPTPRAERPPPPRRISAPVQVPVAAPQAAVEPLASPPPPPLPAQTQTLTLPPAPTGPPPTPAKPPPSDPNAPIATHNPG